MWSPPTDKDECIDELNRREVSRTEARKLVKEWGFIKDWDYINSKRNKEEPYIKEVGKR